MNMSPEEHKRWTWLKSQERWHKRRWHKTGLLWHYEQHDFYCARAFVVAGKLTSVIAKVMREHSARLAENVTRNNALLERLKMRPIFRDMSRWPWDD
jgi:hypothetical protein